MAALDRNINEDILNTETTFTIFNILHHNKLKKNKQDKYIKTDKILTKNK